MFGGNFLPFEYKDANYYEVIRIPNSVWSFLCCFVKNYITQ